MKNPYHLRILSSTFISKAKGIMNNPLKFCKFCSGMAPAALSGASIRGLKHKKHLL
jgi:hypothetical protein